MSLTIRLPLSDSTVTRGYDASGGSIVLINTGVSSVQDTAYKQVAVFGGEAQLELPFAAVPSAAFGRRRRCFSLWAKPSATFGVLFSTGASSADGGLFRASVSATGQVIVDYAGLPASVTDTSLSMDVWAHVIVCYDGSSVKCYINGSLALDESKVLATIESGVHLGKAADQLGYQGSMSDFRLYNNALSEQDVSDLFEEGPNELLKLGSSELTVFQHDGIQPEIVLNDSAVAVGDVTTSSITLIDEKSASGETVLQSCVYSHDDTTSARVRVSENLQTVNPDTTACTSAVRLCTGDAMQTCLEYSGEFVGIHSADDTADECIATANFDGLSFDSDEAAVILGPFSEFRIKYDGSTDTLQIQHLEEGVYNTKVEYGR